MPIVNESNDEQLLQESLSQVGKLMSVEDSKTLNLTGINEQIDHLMGQILTILEASIINPIQLKAVKDLVKQKFYDKKHWIYDLTTMKNEDIGCGWVVRIQKCTCRHELGEGCTKCGGGKQVKCTDERMCTGCYLGKECELEKKA